MRRSVLLACALVSRAAAFDGNQTDLGSALLGNYNRLSPPAILPVARMQMNMQNIIEMDTAVQSIKLQAWFRQYWRDERLTWDPAEWGGRTSYIMPRDLIWTPDVVVYETIEQSVPFEVMAQVYHTGDLFSAQPTTITMHCLMQLDDFPFDTQTCNFTLGSWNMNGFQLGVLPRLDGDSNQVPVVIDGFHQHTEFKLIEARSVYENQYYSCCPEPYPTIKFFLQIRREYLAYTYSIILPLIVSTAVGFCSFVLTPDSGERISLSVTVLLTVVAIYLVAHDEVPKVNRWTMISSLYMVSQSSMLLVTVISIVAVSLHNVRPNAGYYSEHRLLKMFHEVDRNDNGELERDELVEAVSRLGLDEKMVKAILADVDKRLGDDGIPHITFPDWLEIVANRSETLTLSETHSWAVQWVMKGWLWLARNTPLVTDPRVTRLAVMRRRWMAEKGYEQENAGDAGWQEARRSRAHSSEPASPQRVSGSAPLHPSVRVTPLVPSPEPASTSAPDASHAPARSDRLRVAAGPDQSLPSVAASLAAEAVRRLKRDDDMTEVHGPAARKIATGLDACCAIFLPLLFVVIVVPLALPSVMNGANSEALSGTVRMVHENKDEDYVRKWVMCESESGVGYSADACDEAQLALLLTDDERRQR